MPCLSAFSVSKEYIMEKIFRPLTAAPFRQNKKYREVLPETPELAKYIRCFWGSEEPYESNIDNTEAGIVIPDVCVDIIYHIDYTENTITRGFCGINDVSFREHYNAEHGHLVSVFAVRFFAWAAYAFSEASLSDTLNGYFDIQERFRWLDTILLRQLAEKSSLGERAKIAEELFRKKLSEARQNQVVDSAVKQIILRKGTPGTAEVAKECFVSTRQLERLFHEYIGITPKKLCNLVRYQFLWNDILNNPDFRVLDAVYQYGYTDQSHLIREFKRYHSMDIREAKEYAYKNVGNIQYLSRPELIEL